MPQLWGCALAVRRPRYGLARTHGQSADRPCDRVDRPIVTLRFDLVAEQPVAALYLV
jgi:hypothetical protein